MNFSRLILFVFTLSLVSGCKQDFDITSPYKEITVVYALLNAKETTHYVRIQKGYQIEGDANAGAAVGDSIYYTDSLKVQVKTLPNGPVFNLTKVDGNNISLPKDLGFFATNPNTLYRFNGNLDESKRYRLEITNTASGKLITAELDLVRDFTTVVPFSAQKLSLRTVSPSNIIFYSAQNAAVYDLKITFPYLEYDAASDALLKDSFVEFYFYKSKFVDDIQGGNNIIDEFNGAIVLNNLRNALEARSDRYRTFNVSKGMKFTIYAGGVEMANYINSQIAQGSGLASNEALPPYTNLANAYGIFSSRYFKTIDSVLLSNDGLDTLACSPLMTGLRFKGSFGQICD
ncbi:MAG: DUF4249 family protein [Bacteroidetes bacterium]|nr:DUF4249 family protein [Bacteroidota bacterium]